jgi:hypothetical protein
MQTERLLKPMARWLRTGDPHATVDRLFRSRHVKDLQLIVATAWASVLAVSVISLAVLVGAIVIDKANWATAVRDFLTFFAPVLAIFGGVLTWAYQVGSARLGVVDLFACEIDTLCRVTTVLGTVDRLVKRFDQGPSAGGAADSGGRAPTLQFASQENYFPVFDGNSRDLQTLEASVVINITAFYTYMKAVRDWLRMLAGIGPGPDDALPAPGAPLADPWHDAARNVVYMLFLGLESARRAIGDLVEFEPEHAERTIVILLSELDAYRFLLSQFPDENNMYHKRIKLREAEYKHLVPELCSRVEAGKALADEEIRVGSHQPEPWKLAWVLLGELKTRYQEAGCSS